MKKKTLSRERRREIAHYSKIVSPVLSAPKETLILHLELSDAAEAMLAKTEKRIEKMLTAWQVFGPPKKRRRKRKVVMHFRKSR